MTQIDWPQPAIIEVKGFSPQELATALHGYGRRIPPRLLQRISNPRVFSLAMRLLNNLKREVDLGIDRLLFNYWEQGRYR
jgi:hypothetical protein